MQAALLNFSDPSIGSTSFVLPSIESSLAGYIDKSCFNEILKAYHSAYEPESQLMNQMKNIRSFRKISHMIGAKIEHCGAFLMIFEN